MKAKFIDFDEQIRTMRVNLNNEARALLRQAKLNKILFNVEDDKTSLVVSDEDGLWNVTSIEMIDDTITINTESHNLEIDFMDCSTDDMVAVYEAIYHHVANLK